MVLTLEVVGQQASKLGASVRKVFSGSGGTIGRVADNDWVIPDPYISGKHARIDFRNGTYFLVDTSTNGVFLNTQENRLTRSQPYPLNNGDRFFIDAYEIRVSIAGSVTSQGASPLSDLFGSSAVPLTAVGQPAQGQNESRGSRPAYAPTTSMPIPGDPFADPFAPASRAHIPSDPFGSGAKPAIPSGGLGDYSGESADVSDPLKLLGLDSKPSVHVPRAEELVARSPLSDHYVPPTPIQRTPPPVQGNPFGGSVGGSAIPDDYDPLSDALPAQKSPAPPPSPVAAPPAPMPRPTPGGSRANTQRTAASPPTSAPVPPVAAPPPPAPPARPAARAPAPAVPKTPPAERPMDRSGTTGKQVDITSLLVGAGLSEAQITPELIENFGRILRVVVAGLMDVLRARERIKDEFRMRMTTFKAMDNNPLKFSANVDDALHNLLVKRNSAYLGPVEAFEDAFQDVRNHQMAMLAGVRVAFEAMLGEFDPDRLREQFDKHVKKGGLLSGPAKLRYWEMYDEKFRAMVKDQESTFRDLFGEEFARAYEEQLERLKAVSRANNKT
jgi:type VI secretion system protein